MLVFHHDKVKRIRKDEKIQIAYICQKINTNRTTYWKWEKGDQTPPEDKVRLLAKALNVSVSEISNLSELQNDKSSLLNEYSESLEDFSDQNLINKNKEILKRHFSILLDFNTKLENNARFTSAVINSIDSLIYIKDEKLNFLTVNNKFLEYINIPVDTSIKGKNDYFFFSQKEAKENITEDKQVIETKKKLSYEKYIPGTNKSKWGIITKIPVLDSKGKVTGLVGCFIDITDRKKSERQNLLLSIYLENLEAGIIVFNKNGKCLYANPSVSHITGYSLDEIYIWNKYIDWIKISQKKTKLSMDQEAGNEVWHYQLTRKNGDKIWIEENYSTEKIFNNEACNISLVTDITEKIKAEEVRKLLEVNFNNINEAVSIWNISNDKLLYSNPAYTKMFDYPITDKSAARTEWINRIYDEDKIHEHKYLQNKNWPKNRTYRYIDNNNKIKYIESITNLTSYNGINCSIHINRDITSIKEKQELEEILKVNLNAISDSIVISEYETMNVIYKNTAFNKLYEYGNDDSIDNDYKFWLSCIHPEDRKKQLSYIIQRRFPTKRRFRILNQSGTCKWIESETTISYFKNIKCYMFIDRDITNEIAKLEAENLLKINFSVKHDYWISIFSKELKLLYISENAEEFGYPIESFYKKGALDDWLTNIVDPAYREQEINYFKKRKWPKERVYKLLLPDSTSKWIRCMTFNSIYKNEKCYIFVEKDITVEKEKNLLYNMISFCIDTISDGIIIKDLNADTVLYVNEAFERITGYSKENFYKSGHDFWYNNCLHPDCKKTEAEYKKHLSWPHEREYKILKPDGEVRLIKSITSKKTIDNETLLTVVIKDITTD